MVFKEFRVEASISVTPFTKPGNGQVVAGPDGLTLSVSRKPLLLRTVFGVSPERPGEWSATYFFGYSELQLITVSTRVTPTFLLRHLTYTDMVFKAHDGSVVFVGIYPPEAARLLLSKLAQHGLSVLEDVSH